jgi:uncharacterized protein YqgC (DUF456 family)
MTVIWAVLFVVAVVAAWCANLVGLPGNWLIVAAAVVYAWLVPQDARAAVGWPTVGVVTGLAIVGEVAEFAAGAAGVKKLGGSWFGATLALVGSVIGAIADVVVGIPVPVIGPLLAALLFGGLGALVGAVVGESVRGTPPGASWRIGTAAFRGRVVGTLAKAAIGAVMAGIAIAAVFVQ